jgi:hypothetical protein
MFFYSLSAGVQPAPDVDHRGVRAGRLSTADRVHPHRLRHSTAENAFRLNLLLPLLQLKLIAFELESPFHSHVS